MREADAGEVAALGRTLSIDPLVARILLNRGISDPVAAGRFVNPLLSGMRDPFLLLGMEQAVERLCRALADGERVCIFGDYDVDGVTATALLTEAFRDFGFDCFYHIPNRMEDGYGLSADGLRAVAGRGAAVVVSVDCGITACDEALLCAELGVDLIITDHHTPGKAIPAARAVINPLQPGCTFPFKQPAGVGLAFYLLVALRSRLRQYGRFDRTPEPDLKRGLQYVALGTIADIVPLVDDNRLFVTYGLRELTGSRHCGIDALKRVSGIAGEVSSGDVGFRLAPRLNAAGRLDDATRAVELLLSRERDQALLLAAELDAGNAERQAIERDILADAQQRAEAIPPETARRSIVLASEEWHAGVIGIVASRLVERFHLPTVLIALRDGDGKGSARSIPRFDLYDALCACAPTLRKFGGHRYAAGVALEGNAVDEFARQFERVAADRLEADDLIPELLIDAELFPDDLTPDVADLLLQLGPYGAGNPEPTLLVRDLRIADKRVLKEKHLKMVLVSGTRRVDAIGFDMADRIPQADRIDCVCTLQMNEWNGRRSLQLRLRDFNEVD